LLPISIISMKLFASVITGAVATKNIVELAQSVDDLSTLVAAVVAGDLVDTLSSAGTYTVFAPTNEAFAKLPFNSLDGLLKPENKDVLVDILTNHVLAEIVPSKDFGKYGLHYIKTLQGGSLSLSNDIKVQDRASGRVCTVTDAGLGCHYFKSVDNMASNGVVHIIDGLLAPGRTPLPNRLASSNIVGLAQSVKDLSTLVTAVVAGDLVETLSSPTAQFTVFAPTNEAFDALPAGTIDSLLKPANKAELVDILTYHVLPSETLSPYFPDRQFVKTVEGNALRLAKSDGKLIVGPTVEQVSNIVSTDNFATNGVVHIIDKVLLPSFESEKTVRLESCGGKKTTTFDIKDGACYSYGGRRDQRVLCEPEGDAFVLEFRSSDGTCTDVTRPDGAYNQPFFVKKGSCFGDIVIDCDPKNPNIVELAESVTDLSTLVAAVVAGDLVDTLSSPGPFTVFAPTNEGFAALPAGTLDSLMKPENKGQLVDILTYHVLSGKVLSTDLEAFQEAKTVEGKKLHITVFGGVVKVGATLLSTDLRTVTAADNLASNGVVHIIDGVLLPPASLATNDDVMV